VFEALRIRDFVLLWSGMSVSLVGDAQLSRGGRMAGLS
jgi:hypothetical protein